MTKIFATDLHGTIVENNQGTQLAVNEALETVGKKERVDIRFIQNIMGLPWGNYFTALFPNATEEEVRRFVSVVRPLSRKYALRYEHLVPYADEVLNEVKRREYHIVLVSIATRESIELTLQRHGILGLFDEFLTITPSRSQEMWAYDTGEYKGSLLKDYIEQVGADRSIMLGDREEDVTAGLMAGAMTVYFNPKGRKSQHATYSIRDLRELLVIV